MDYTVQELLHNQSFRRMVKGAADMDEIKRWNRWIEANDGNRRKAKEATAEIAGFEFKSPQSSNISAEWNRLHRKIKKDRIKTSRSDRKGGGIHWLYRVAAILLIVGLTGVGVYMYSAKKHLNPEIAQIIKGKTIKTGPTERQTITFSDGSRIILNHHSTMSYQTGQSQGQTTKVELHGEAYFEAVKGSREFAVYTPDGVVRDVGTKFLVTVDKNHSRIVLQAGKVKINTKGQKDSSREITMKKGEMLSFNQSGIVSKKMVNPSFYTSWATGFMHFNHTSIRKFAGYVEKKFSVQVKIVNPKLKNIKIDGSIYFKSLAGLVRSVSKVIGVRAYQSKDGKIVYLGNPSQ
jgi:ferric-dicitrate binding protein FerR (iron transport regulator)